jgi:hypothetical protein
LALYRFFMLLILRYVLTGVAAAFAVLVVAIVTILLWGGIEWAMYPFWERIYRVKHF